MRRRTSRIKRRRLRPTLVGTFFVVALIGGLSAMGASPAEIGVTLVFVAMGVGLTLWISFYLWKDID